MMAVGLIWLVSAYVGLLWLLFTQPRRTRVIRTTNHRQRCRR